MRFAVITDNVVTSIIETSDPETVKDLNVKQVSLATMVGDIFDPWTNRFYRDEISSGNGVFLEGSRTYSKVL